MRIVYGYTIVRNNNHWEVYNKKKEFECSADTLREAVAEAQHLYYISNKD